MTNDSIRLSRKWQVIAWAVFAALFVVLPIFSMPESTWNMLCNAAEVIGHNCDAQSGVTYEQPEAQIIILAMFAMMFSVLIVMTFAGMILLNWIVASMPFFVAIKKAFWPFQFPQSVLTLMVIASTSASLHLLALLLYGAPEVHIIALFGAAITTLVTILFTLVAMWFSKKHKQEITTKLDKLIGIDSTLTDINSTLNSIRSELEKNAGALEKINKKLDKQPNGS